MSIAGAAEGSSNANSAIEDCAEQWRSEVATSHTNGPLTAPSSSSSGGNGVYAYGSSSLFPGDTYNSNSYGVDVLFRPQLVA
jgi:hypothetical protein